MHAMNEEMGQAFSPYLFLWAGINESFVLVRPIEKKKREKGNVCP